MVVILSSEISSSVNCQSHTNVIYHELDIIHPKFAHYNDVLMYTKIPPSTQRNIMSLFARRSLKGTLSVGQVTFEGKLPSGHFRNRGIAKTIPGVHATHPENQNEENNNKKK